MIDFENSTKDQLVSIAINNGLVSSKNAARKISKNDLVETLKKWQEENHGEAPAPVVSEPNVLKIPEHEITPASERPTPEKLPDAESTVPPTDGSEPSLIVKVGSIAPVTLAPKTEKRFPHGAKSSWEVAQIKAFKKRRNQRKHWMKLIRDGHGWANGSNILAINGFKEKRICNPVNARGRGQLAGTPS